MNQKAYIKRLSEKFGVENCKYMHTPANSNSKLMKIREEEAFAPKCPYCELVGALMYIATCTRPDIAHAVGEVAKFCERYNKSHLTAAKRILKYLKTKGVRQRSACCRRHSMGQSKRRGSETTS